MTLISRHSWPTCLCLFFRRVRLNSLSKWAYQMLRAQVGSRRGKYIRPSCCHAAVLPICGVATVDDVCLKSELAHLTLKSQCILINILSCVWCPVSQRSPLLNPGYQNWTMESSNHSEVGQSSVGQLCLLINISFLLPWHSVYLVFGIANTNRHSKWQKSSEVNSIWRFQTFSDSPELEPHPWSHNLSSRTALMVHVYPHVSKLAQPSQCNNSPMIFADWHNSCLKVKNEEPPLNDVLKKAKETCVLVKEANCHLL